MNSNYFDTLETRSFDESENDDERSAIERGLRAIVTFQERVGDLPIKKETRSSMPK